MINLVCRRVGPAAIIAIAVIAAPAVRADDRNHDSDDNRYIVTNLVSDIAALGGQQIDPVLQNAWGVAFTPGASPFWIADNATGCSTLYDGTGLPQPQPNPLRVKIPLPGGGVTTDCKHVDPNNPPTPTPAAPTGLVWNPSAAFAVPGTKSATNPNGIAAAFIWDTEDGTISAWAGGLTPSDQAVLAVDNSASGAVYKGLVVGVNAAHGVLLFATNFNAGKIDVFGPPKVPGGTGSDGLFTSVKTDDKAFTDPDIPSGFAPFGIQNINGNLFVTYALQNSKKHDDVAGPGNGFVDIYDTDGNLLQRFASGRPLNSPWGVTRASFAFGRFSGDILVGNFGDGRIHAFDSDGNFRGTVRDNNGKPIVIEGLWTLTLGGGRNSNSDTLYFTAGPNGETDGLFGTITPVADDDDK
jgi:uncharacterized protein (TIGR03118 family)